MGIFDDVEEPEEEKEVVKPAKVKKEKELTPAKKMLAEINQAQSEINQAISSPRLETTTEMELRHLKDRVRELEVTKRELEVENLELRNENRDLSVAFHESEISPDDQEVVKVLLTRFVQSRKTRLRPGGTLEFFYKSLQRWVHTLHVEELDAIVP